jgi:hypothetical protein
MEVEDYSQFHELAEQMKGQMTLRKLCEQEGIKYKVSIR